jgi:soluble lytic murein transglycosylase-like protein
MTQTQRLMARGLLFLSCQIVFCGAVGGMFGGGTIDPTPTLYTGTVGFRPLEDLRQSLAAAAMGENEIRTLQLNRHNAISGLSSRYRTSANLSAMIHDEALRAGLDPDLAFRLVQVESNFNPRAHSTAAALGLAQVQLATARHYSPRITENELYDPQQNVRIAFHYLRDLHDRYAGDMRLALLAYNVGPGRLQEILDGGKKPAESYAAAVLKGYSR